MKINMNLRQGLMVGLGFAVVGLGAYYLQKQYPQIFSLKRDIQAINKIKSLTKIAAEARASCIASNIDYKLLLNLKEGHSYTGIIKQQFVLKKQTPKLFLDYNGESIKQLLVNRQPLKTSQKFAEFWDGSFINIPESALVPGNNSIEIWFENSYCKDGQGLHECLFYYFDNNFICFFAVVDTDQKQYIYSNLEPYWASRIFPCIDQPNLKGTFELIVINPKSHVCIANETPKQKEKYDGNIIIKQFGETDLNILEFLKSIDDNSNLWIFPPTKVISSYLFAVISGPFKEVKCQNTYKSYFQLFFNYFSNKDIQMSCFCRESLYEEMKKCAEQLFTITIEAMKFYEKLFQYPYPFSKYDSIFCPEYNCGAMENVGAVTFNDMYLYKGEVALEKISRRAQTITHELAHMWFGNLVTMDWWDDLWLNESFADFVALYCLREIGNNFPFQLSDFNVMSNMRKIWGYREDGKISTHPIAAEVNDTDEADSIFDGITYSKGQAVIRQLLNLLGRDNFSNGLKEYFTKYEYKNAKFADFLETLQKHFRLEEKPEYTLNNWADEWLRTPSYNQVTPVWNPNNFSEKAEMEIIQECVQTEYPTLRHHKMQVAFYGSEGQLLEVQSVLVKPENSTKLIYNGYNKVNGILLNYEDDCFVKVILDKTSLEFFKKNLSKIKEVSTRNLVWRALYDMVHDGTLSSKELIDLACTQIPQEKETVLNSLVFMFCRLSITFYTPMKAKPLLKQSLFQMILKHIKSQVQMSAPTKQSFQDELVDNAVGKEELDYMEQFLQESNNLTEIALTLEQKWVIATAFARSQHHTREKKLQIVQIMEKVDNSSDGKLHVETCMTAINQSPEEKDVTWKQLIDPKSKKSLFSSIAVMKGFNLDETWETSRKFHDLFFENLINVFKTRQLQFAQNYFGLLFPKSEDFAYLIRKVDKAIKEANNMQTLKKLLIGAKDQINVRMRAVETYSKFETQNQ